MKTYKITILAILFISLQIGVKESVNAQEDLTRYFMNSIPQSHYTNPALIPKEKWHIGFPGLSSLYLGVQLPFTPNKLFNIGTGDSTELSMDDLVKSLKKKRNFLSLQLEEEILNFGFKIKEDQYFNFSISEKVFFNLSLPQNLFIFLNEGNRGETFKGKEVDLSGIGINAMHYHEIAAGYSRVINDKITVGGRLKYLRGSFNFNTKDFSFKMEAPENLDYLTITPSYSFNTNLPISFNGIPREYDGINNTDSNQTEPIFSINDSLLEEQMTDYIMGKGGSGIALDLGGQYKLNEKITLTASLTELGFIRWKLNPVNFKNKNEGSSYKYEGVTWSADDVADLLEGDNDENNTATSVDVKESTDEAWTKVESMRDSLIDAFDIVQTNDKYTTMLNSRFYIGGTYNLTEKDRVGALLRGHIYNKSFHPSMTLSYNKRFGGGLSTTLSYSIYNREYSNLGLGFSVNVFPWQIYFVTDNLFMTRYDQIGDDESAVPVPRSKNLSFHFGMNFQFGYKDKVKEPKEKKEKEEKEDMHKRDKEVF